MGAMLKAGRRKKMCAAGETSVNFIFGKAFLHCVSLRPTLWFHEGAVIFVRKVSQFMKLYTLLCSIIPIFEWLLSHLNENSGFWKDVVWWLAPELQSRAQSNLHHLFNCMYDSSNMRAIRKVKKWNKELGSSLPKLESKSTKISKWLSLLQKCFIR